MAVPKADWVAFTAEVLKAWEGKPKSKWAEQMLELIKGRITGKP